MKTPSKSKAKPTKATKRKPKTKHLSLDDLKDMAVATGLKAGSDLHYPCNCRAIDK